MTVEELLQQGKAQAPHLIQKTAACLFLIERLAPEFLPEVMEDFSKIASRLDAKMKTAGWKEEARNIGVDASRGAAKAVATTLLAGAALAGTTDLLRAAKRGLTSSTNWKRMMEATPELKGKDQTRVRQAFKSLQKHAPDVASDPLAAGAIVYRMSNAVVGDHDRVLRDAVQLQKDRVQSTYDTFKNVPKVEYKQQVNINDNPGGRRKSSYSAGP